MELGAGVQGPQLTPDERRPALAMIALGALLGILGLLPADERIGIVLWLIAAPMVGSGAIAIAWGNAREQVERMRSGKQ